jgi:sugar diacid utilization regulator
MGTRSPALRAAIIRRMRDQLDELVSEVVRRILKGNPEYAEVQDKAVLADVEVAVRRNTSIVLAVLQDQRHLHPDELTAIRANGARRCEQDLPLDSLIEAIRTGIKTGMEWATKMASSLSDPAGQAASVLSELHQDFFDLFHDIATVSRQGYMESKAHRSAKLRERTELFQEVLAGTFKTEEEICAQAARLGYDLRSPNGLIFFAGPDSDPQAFKRATSAFIEAVPAVVELPLARLPSPHVVFVVPSATEHTWPKATAAAKEVVAQHPFVALATSPVSAPGALRASYEGVKEMVSLAIKVCSPGAFVNAGDLIVFRIIQATDRQKLQHLIQQTLQPILGLTDKTKSALLDTIEAMHLYNRTKAAKVLNVSLKTLNKRWNRISELTGLRLEASPDRLRLDLALYALRLVQEDL